MPRRKYASKDFSEPGQARRNERVANRTVGAGVEDFEGLGPNVHRGYASGLEALVEWIGQRADGWLRLVPDKAGHTHWKWRFTEGPWAGHYVYWKQDQYETASSAFHGLAAKLDLVDTGGLKPARDVYQ